MKGHGLVGTTGGHGLVGRIGGQAAVKVLGQAAVAASPEILGTRLLGQAAVVANPGRGVGVKMRGGLSDFDCMLIGLIPPCSEC